MRELCLECAHSFDDDEGLYCNAKSPIAWVGGKYYLANKIIPIFPEHTTYAEPFGGAMHVLFKKPPSTCEVYNDIDSQLYNFFKVVKDEEKLNQLLDMLQYVLHSRQLFNECLENMENGTDVEQAFCFYIVNRQCFGGKIGTWGYQSSAKKKRLPDPQSFTDHLVVAHKRICKVQIENDDFEAVIKRFDTPSTLFYCDPPYMFNRVRGNTKMYKNEMDQAAHSRLVDTLKGIQGRFVLSGYNNELYNDAFKRLEIGESNMNVQKIADGKKRTKKVEYVWVNF